MNDTNELPAAAAHARPRRIHQLWLNLPIRYKGAAVIALPLISLLVIVAAFAWQQQNTATASGWVVHTQQVRLTAQRLRNTIGDAEGAVRGYDITANQDFLTASTQSLNSISGLVADLTGLVRDNPAQGQRVREIADLMRQRADTLTANVEIATAMHAGRPRAEALKANVLRGKTIMDRLHTSMDVFLAEEERLQGERDQMLRDQQWATQIVLVMAALVGLGGGVAAAYLFGGGIARRVAMLSDNARRLALGQPLLRATSGQDEIGRLDRELCAAAGILAERESLLRRRNAELADQNRRVEEATRLKSEFLANMSHELRTPLNGIIGFAELMHDGKVGPISDDHREYLGDILTSARHLLQLINDILDLSKVEAGKMEFRPEPVDLAKVVGEVRDIVRGMAARKRTRLEIVIDPALGQVVIDPARFKQVLYNYLSNALKFTPDEGRVVVRALPEGDESFRLEVQDTGVGIRPEDIGKLFVEFQQLDDGAAKQYQGTGLGLALTRRIVEAQGGRVGVSSEPGVGSTFFAVLPRVAQTTETLPASEPVPAVSVPEDGPTVLVIEDDPQEQSWLMRTIAAAGYRVVAAASGANALALCRERRFDALTLDLLLPDMSGWEVLSAIRADTPNHDTPAIVVSVVAEREVGLGFPIHDFLVKPVHADDLLGSLVRAGVEPGPSATVLVVDDDPNALKIMAATLRQLDIRPVCRPDGASGLQAAAAEHPSAVVLDLLMPGMDGFEFLEQFRQTDQGRHTPVIVWTNKDLTADERTRLEASARAVVMKQDGGATALIAELRSHIAGAGYEL